MKYYYRISDSSYHKIKLPGASKRVCLENFIDVFMPLPEELIIVADNCGIGTLNWLRRLDFDLRVTNLGNAGALLYSLKDALAKNTKRYEGFYFVEDDYLHDPKRAYKVLQEGRWCVKKRTPGSLSLGEKTEYWTLFDHPDKYSAMYQHHEVGRIYRSQYSHWKQSVSTTMTFATTYDVLDSDFPIWESHLDNAIEKGHGHPPDHEIFKSLGEAGRELYVAIPGAATHTDMTHFGLVGAHHMDSFAVELMFDMLYEEVCRTEEGKLFAREMVGEKPSKCFVNLSRLAAIKEGFCPENSE